MNEKEYEAIRDAAKIVRDTEINEAVQAFQVAKDAANAKYQAVKDENWAKVE